MSGVKRQAIVLDSVGLDLAQALIAQVYAGEIDPLAALDALVKSNVVVVRDEPVLAPELMRDVFSSTPQIGYSRRPDGVGEGTDRARLRALEQQQRSRLMLATLPEQPESRQQRRARERAERKR